MSKTRYVIDSLIALALIGALGVGGWYFFKHFQRVKEEITEQKAKQPQHFVISHEEIIDESHLPDYLMSEIIDRDHGVLCFVLIRRNYPHLAMSCLKIAVDHYDRVP